MSPISSTTITIRPPTTNIDEGSQNPPVRTLWFEQCTFIMETVYRLIVDSQSLALFAKRNHFIQDFSGHLPSFSETINQ
ncbi:hypothetical protein J6590_059847 [Homalodisca vitripennis]|nr:hypothetical protein J6590_059847 [Homalodisca vitripennis]